MKKEQARLAAQEPQGGDEQGVGAQEGCSSGYVSASDAHEHEGDQP